MEHDDQKPFYSRDRAASLLCVSYRETGADVEKDIFLKSAIENDLGELPDCWNVGLFRMLDEAIFLTKIVSMFSGTLPLKQKEFRSQTILAYQIEKTLLAIRSLCALGLDGPARQNLRSLYEMCHTFCRSLIDPDFCREFSHNPTLETSNAIWHKYISRAKTEKFLTSYNETATHKCPLVIDNSLDQMRKVLGVGVHPNYIGWMFDWEDDRKNSNEGDSTFMISPQNATEFVLVSSLHLSLLTLAFSGSIVGKSLTPLGFLAEHPLFKHQKDDADSISSISAIATMMFFMNVKWLNREREDFDPEVHF